MKVDEVWKVRRHDDVVRRCDDVEDYNVSTRGQVRRGSHTSSEDEASGWVKHVAQGRRCWTLKVLSSHGGGRMLMMEGDARVRKDVMKTWSERGWVKVDYAEGCHEDMEEMKMS